MQIHLKGIENQDRQWVQNVILNCMGVHGVVYSLWTWSWEGSAEITDGEGELIGQGANIELPGTEAIRVAVKNGLLEDISQKLPGVVVYVSMAPVEASYGGTRI